nr:hypothetical protein Iba_chr08dCG9320 [Ipomoea batatas]
MLLVPGEDQIIADMDQHSLVYVAGTGGIGNDGGIANRGFICAAAVAFGNDEPVALAPEPPGDDVIVCSHVIISLLPVDVPVATVPVPHPTFPPETGAALSETRETIDSAFTIGVSLESTTVDSLAAWLELEGPGSILALGSREKWPKFCTRGAPSRSAGGFRAVARRWLGRRRREKRKLVDTANRRRDHGQTRALREGSEAKTPSHPPA